MRVVKDIKTNFRDPISSSLIYIRILISYINIQDWVRRVDHLKSVSQMSLIISHERVLLRVKNNYKHSHTVILLENGPKFKQIDGPVISNEF